MQAAILEHLSGPASNPSNLGEGGGEGEGEEEYTAYMEKIGSDNTAAGYHGYIAILVIIRTSLRDSGLVTTTASAVGATNTGMNLVLATAGNKGGVAIPIQVRIAVCGLS